MRSRSPRTWLFFALLAVSCGPREIVPETGRSRPALRYSEKEMETLGAEAYAEMSETHKVVSGTADAKRVAAVGRRIAVATRKNYPWQFRLYDEPEIANAFCMPGGKIGVFSGILPLTQNDDGLAVVLSHEIAHATLQHSNERMSQPALKQLVGLPVSIGVGLWGAVAPGTRKLAMSAFGLGSVVGVFLPYSQRDETEADDVGLIYMKRAGFDLTEAPRLWLRLAEEENSKGQISDAVSTHPDPRQRAARLDAKIRAMR